MLTKVKAMKKAIPVFLILESKAGETLLEMDLKDMNKNDGMEKKTL